MRRAAAPLLAALIVAGCGINTGGGSEGEATLTVYVSAPLTGPARADGNAVADGARTALEDAGGEAGGIEVLAEYLDVAGRNESRFDPVTTAANARTATEDSTSVAYIGELDSGASRTSVPITNSAGLLQVAPGSGAVDLVKESEFDDDVPEQIQTTGERTFAQLVPTYAPGDATGDPPDYKALGYEAMASVLAAIDRAADPTERADVVNAYFDGTERDSRLGPYYISTNGEFISG
jgi:ABC-type branched-subunit amino acid transport system substrate-binding protein